MMSVSRMKAQKLSCVIAVSCKVVQSNEQKTFLQRPPWAQIKVFLSVTQPRSVGSLFELHMTPL